MFEGFDKRENTYYYEKNLLFRLLIGTGKYRISRLILFYLGWYALICIFCASGCILWTVDVDKVKVTGLFQDWFLYTFIIIQILGVYLTLRLFDKMEFLQTRLPEIIRDDKIHIEKQKVRDFISIRTSRSKICYKIWLGLMFLLVCIFQFYIPLFSHNASRAWAIYPQKYPIVFIIGSLWSTFQWVVVVGNFTWYVLSASLAVFLMIHRYAKRKQLIVSPVAPDGKGGISSIGDVSSALTFIMSTGMLLVIVWTIQFGLDPTISLAFPIYALFLTGLFFLPLQSVHQAMKNAKNYELHRLALLFSNEYIKLPSIEQIKKQKSNSEAENSLKSTIDYLGHFLPLYLHVERMPIWPYNFKNLSRFFSVILIPLVLIIVGELLKKYCLH